MAQSSRRQFVRGLGITTAALCGASLTTLATASAKLADQNAVDPEAIRKLGARISGHIITPASSDYDAARVVFNRAFDRHPALIVRCAGASDVARSLDFAQTHNLPLAVRGGGHSRAGFGVCDGGVVVDMSGMKQIEVDRDQRVARAEAGCLVHDMDEATQRVGLATTLGGCPTVGIASFTLGGGEGLLMSKYGAGCDNLLSAQLVTVDGRQVEASEKSNPDLFWAVRGGGGNFGVVTSLKYKLHPVTDVLSGTMTFPPGRIPEMLQAFSRFVAAAPDEMNVVGIVMPSEQGARFHVLVCHCGDPDKGNSLLKPLRALNPAEEHIRVASYLETQRSINPYTSVAHFQTDLFLPELSTAAIETMNAATKNAPPNMRLFIVPLYGAVSRVGVSDTAFPLRKPGYEVDIMGRWTDASGKKEAVEWVTSVRDKLHPFATGAYSNQLGETSEALVRAAYGTNYARLAEIKKKYDPSNVLQMNQNIKPS